MCEKSETLIFSHGVQSSLRAKNGPVLRVEFLCGTAFFCFSFFLCEVKKRGNGKMRKRRKPREARERELAKKGVEQEEEKKIVQEQKNGTEGLENSIRSCSFSLVWSKNCFCFCSFTCSVGLLLATLALLLSI